MVVGNDGDRILPHRSLSPNVQLKEKTENGLNIVKLQVKST